ncbi:hypothetical protein BH09PSE5_BH09PSE5_27870 [soil metagenome]
MLRQSCESCVKTDGCFRYIRPLDLFNPNLLGERRERLDLLVETLEQKGDKVMVPTPAYAEFLVKADKAKSSYYKKIESSRVFRVEPFSQRAAIECADLLERGLHCQRASQRHQDQVQV